MNMVDIRCTETAEYILPRTQCCQKYASHKKKFKIKVVELNFVLSCFQEIQSAQLSRNDYEYWYITIITCIVILGELISWLQWRHLLRITFQSSPPIVSIHLVPKGPGLSFFTRSRYFVPTKSNYLKKKKFVK